jgi:signal transduction histidine kinase/Tfp pilus assembly protein PilF
MWLKGGLVVVMVFALPFGVAGQDENAVAEFRRLVSNTSTGSTEDGITSAELRIEQAHEIGDARQEVRAKRDLGWIYLSRVHDYEKALDLFIDALALSDSLGLEDQLVLIYVSMAHVFEVVGDHKKSSQLLENALSINRERRSINADALILNNLGKVNAVSGRLEEARKNFQQVLKYRSDIDRTYEAEALSNLGQLRAMEGKFQEALDYHREALRVNRTLRDQYAEANSLNDIGVLYGQMNNDERSQANHVVALEIRQKIGDKKGVAESCNNLAALYLRTNKPLDAITYGTLALEQAGESQAREQLLRSYEHLSLAYKMAGDFQKALEHKERSMAILELIQSEKQDRQLLEAENRYVLSTKENEIQRLDTLRREREREIASERKFRNILFLVAGLIFITAGLLLVLYLVKRRSNRKLQAARREVERKNQKLEELNHTKDKFFSIISHDLRGPLNSLTSFSRLLMNHTESMSKEEIKLLASDLDKSVQNLLALLENLLEWSRSQTGNIDFTPERFNLREILVANKELLDGQAKAKRISIDVDAEYDVFVNLHKNSITTVVRNLVSNAIKFTPAGGSVTIKLTTDPSGLLLSVVDTGVGMSKEVMAKLFQVGSKHSTKGTANEKGTGLGLILCREFIERNGGTLSVDSVEGKGSKFTCRFPSSIIVSLSSEPKSTAVSF